MFIAFLPKAIEGAKASLNRTQGKKGKAPKAPQKRAPNAGDQEKLKRLENKKRYEQQMEGFCGKVAAQIPPGRNPGHSEWEAQFSAFSGYLFENPHIEIPGSVSLQNLSRDVYRCYQFRYAQAVESEERADRYNRSKEGQAEMKRQTAIDNARLRKHFKKYPPRK